MVSLNETGHKKINTSLVVVNSDIRGDAGALEALPGEGERCVMGKN